MSRDVEVSILVPVRDEEVRIASTAAAMLGQCFAGELEWLFVDGRSRDGTRAILDQLANRDRRVRVLDNPRRTIPAALNIGLARAQGTYVARMDAHSWYPRDYLERGIDRLKRGDVQWVTGPAVPRATSRWGATVAVALGTWLGRGGSTKWQSGGAAGDEEIELDTGVFGGIWRRETLERLGGWDEEFLVNEDAEMAARVISAAGRIVCLRTMGATYAPRDGLWALARQYCRFGMYRVRTSRRHPVALRRSHLLSAGLALTAGAAVSAPRPMRTAARTTMSAYATALLAVAAGTPADAGVRARLPVVLAVMHHAWGTGFIVGCARYGIPMAAIRRVLCASSAPTEPRPAGRGGR